MTRIALLFLLASLAACGPKNSPPTAPAAAAAADSGGVKSYAKATAGTTARTGLFKVHTADDKLLYEIPREQLGKPFLWVSQIAQAQEGTGYGGTSLGNRVVRWELRGKRVLLRQESYGIVAPDSISAAYGVQAATFPRVIRAFDVAAFAPDSAPVIDVTKLFTTDVAELSPRDRLGRVRRLDTDRSFLENVAVFPENINVEALLTFEMDQPANVPSFQRPEPTISALVHHSMAKLPDQPMMPRLADERVGFFTVSQRDYSQPLSVDENTSYAVSYITRWRLECAPGEVAPCEPVQPIVYYLGREIPDEFRASIKRGIESWQPAFEAAGFRNAIIARDPPSVAEDPDWSAEDARISSIRWYPTDDTNAMGPHVHDPRTGEILESDIIMHGGLLDRYRAMYIAQVGAGLGVRGGQLPDSVQQEVLRSVIAHEVGHAIGLQHNMSASSAYPVDSLRSGSFTRRYSVSPSIMDYTRFNYVAQPEDDALRVRILGPYDYFAVNWGYAPVPGATPQAKQATLNEWAAATATDPTITFSSNRYNARQLTEDLGDDPVRATEYGLANINRSFASLKTAMAVPGDNFGNLEYMYGQLLGQRSRMFNHVAALLGGSYWASRTYGQEGTVYRPVPRDEQQRALRFLNRVALQEPAEMTDAATLRMFDPFGGTAPVMQSQTRLVNSMLDDDRIAAMSAQLASAEPGEQVYSHTAYLADLRGLLFQELRPGRVAVDAYRRNVQRSYVDRAATMVADTATHGEVRAVLRAELAEVRATARSARPRAADAATRAHLMYLDAAVEAALEPG